MKILNHCLCSFIILALSSFSTGSVAARTKTIDAFDTLDVYVQKLSPEWLPEYQNIQISLDSGEENALLLMETFLARHVSDEFAFQVVGSHYFILASERSWFFLESLSWETLKPWIIGPLCFLKTLAANQQLLAEQAESLFTTQWLKQTLWFIWCRQSQQQALLDRTLEELQRLQEHQPDSLILAWLKGELIRLNPNGRYWEVEQAWQAWTERNPETDPELVRIYRQLHFQILKKSQHQKPGGSWLLPGADAAWAFNLDNMKQKAGSRESHYYHKEHWELIESAWRAMSAALICFEQNNRKLYDLKLCTLALSSSQESTATLCALVGDSFSRDNKKSAAAGECLDLQQQLGLMAEDFLTKKRAQEEARAVHPEMVAAFLPKQPVHRAADDSGHCRTYCYR